MKDFIVIAGAPGSGKSTVAKLLQEKLGCPRVNLGWIRQWHLKRDWSNANKEEEEMSFDNLVYALHNYAKHGYKNVLVEDLEDDKVRKIPELFTDNFLIISLVVNSDEELGRRVLNDRDSGFKNVQAAIEWNMNLRARDLLPNEVKLDNTQITPEETMEAILKLI